MDAVAESERKERIPRASRFCVVMKNEKADARRDGQTCLLARPNSQARTGTGKLMFTVQLTTSRNGNHASIKIIR